MPEPRRSPRGDSDVRLRPLRASDADAIVAACQDPERAGYERLPGRHPAPRTGITERVFVRYVSRRG